MMYPLDAPIDFRTPMSRVRSITVVYIESRITRKPIETASAIMLSMKASRPGKFEAVIKVKKSFRGRISYPGNTGRIPSITA